MSVAVIAHRENMRQLIIRKQSIQPCSHLSRGRIGVGVMNMEKGSVHFHLQGNTMNVRFDKATAPGSDNCRRKRVGGYEGRINVPKEPIMNKNNSTHLLDGKTIDYTYEGGGDSGLVSMMD